MKKILKSLSIFIGVLVVLAVVLVFNFGHIFNVYLFPPSAQKYGEIAIDLMDKNGLYANTDEWKNEKTLSLQKLEDANSYDDVLVILDEAISMAGGKHSFIKNANEETSTNSSSLVFPTFSIEDDVLVIKVPSFQGTSEEGLTYAEILSNAISTEKYLGVVLDFSDNGGGDINPMVVGLSQLLPDGELFSFLYTDEREQKIILQDGSVNFGGSNVVLDVSKKDTDIPIAIIFNENTGSSGEFAFLSFDGLKNTKTFGKDSAGYATVNQTFYLYDGSIMNLTCANVKTRTNEIYGDNPISPDIYTQEPLKDALEWISENSK